MRECHTEDRFAATGLPSSITPIPTTISSIIQARTIEVSMLFLLAVLFVMWLLWDPRFDARFRILAHGVAPLIGVCMMWKVWRFQGARKKLRREMAIAEYYRRRHTDGNPGEFEDENENESDLAAFLEEHRLEIFGDGAHNLCGCARSEVRWFGNRFFGPKNNQEIENNREDERADDRQGFCFNAWRCLSKLFCGLLFGCHLQLFGICATAQETRHLREAIPPRTRAQVWQRDYITMQPWTEYYPSILKLRILKQFDLISHFKALSKLSRQILVAVAVSLIFVTLTFLLPIRFPKWQILIVRYNFACWIFKHVRANFLLQLSSARIHQVFFSFFLLCCILSYTERFCNPLSSCFLFTGCGIVWICPWMQS